MTDLKMENPRTITQLKHLLKEMNSPNDQKEFIREIVKTWEFHSEQHQKGENMDSSYFDSDNQPQCIYDHAESYELPDSKIGFQFNARSLEETLCFELTKRENRMLGATKYLEKNLKFTEYHGLAQDKKQNQSLRR